MTDFEAFCSELQRERHNPAYISLSSARKALCNLVLSNPAASLALQRLEAADRQGPLLLYDLIERYARNEYQLPCDHVYALYSLVGDHRQFLRVDYTATPAQRLTAVLRFVQTYERLPPWKMLDFAALLTYLFQTQAENVRQVLRLPGDLHLVVSPSILGTVELQPETQGSRTLRRKIQRLDSTARYVLDTSNIPWACIATEGHDGSQSPVAQQDMTYITIQGSNLHGLATCPLERPQMRT